MSHQKIFFEFDDLCKELKIEWCFTLGTALGLYRQKAPIGGDNDIDLMVFCGHRQLEKMRKKLIELGFKYAGMNMGAGEEMNMHFHKYGMLLDAHFQCLEEEERFYDEFDQVNYCGRTFNVPHPIEEYLQFEYFENTSNPSNWRIPDMGKSRPIKNQGTRPPGSAKGINPQSYFGWAKKTKFRWEDCVDPKWQDNQDNHG